MIDARGVLLATAVCAVPLAGCAAGNGTTAAAPVTVTVTASPTTNTAFSADSTATPSAPATSDTTSTTTGAAASDAPTMTSETTAGPVIGAQDRGRTLTLDRFLQTRGEWHASQFDIADQTGVQGIAVETNQCVEDYAPTLEVRLGNNFDKLSLKVAQSNGSETQDSQQRVVVQIVGNGAIQRVYRVPFNTIQPITQDVNNVNALQIRVFLDPEVERCGNGRVQVVLSDITVS